LNRQRGSCGHGKNHISLDARIESKAARLHCMAIRVPYPLLAIGRAQQGATAKPP
jgi:hypothetical protein